MPLKTAVFLLSLASLSFTLSSTYAATASTPQNSQQTITLDVQNMTCSMCQFTIKKALQNVVGVQKVTVDYDNKTAIVKIDPQQTNSKALIKATTNAGYPATARQ